MLNFRTDSLNFRILLLGHNRRNLNDNVLTKQKTNQIGCLFVNLGKIKLSGEATTGGSMLLRKNFI